MNMYVRPSSTGRGRIPDVSAKRSAELSENFPRSGAPGRALQKLPPVGRSGRALPGRALPETIRVSQHGNGWEIQFNVFNTRGGVELVRARGRSVPFAVDTIDVMPVKPDGEFTYPLSGSHQ